MTGWYTVVEFTQAPSERSHEGKRTTVVCNKPSANWRAKPGNKNVHLVYTTNKTFRPGEGRSHQECVQGRGKPQQAQLAFLGQFLPEGSHLFLLIKGLPD